ncbi:helicase associated domain-containing protein, partial [Candidatus Thioglobus sp.]|nr:helicase associated domain-containing protein [Candidatus Thioglobus sp.]
EIGFIWHAKEYAWNKGYQYLKQYVIDNKDTLVNSSYKVDNYRLGHWAVTQRAERSKDRLSPERIQKLDELGFVWKNEEYAWNKSYQHLEQYVKDNGDALVPYRCKIDEYALGTWVGAQRKAKVKNILSSKRIQKLDELGFVWKVKKGPR